MRGNEREPIVGIPDSGAEIQNSALFGLGTTADPQNPFSARINKALWTALYSGDGGDGDLFYTMNKEATGSDVGFLLQTDFVTKALVGLFGSDNLRIAVSTDGSAFSDAIEIDEATGIVDLPSNPKFSGSTNFDNYIATNSWTTISINTTDYNDQNAFDAGSNRFTAPIAGLYTFGATCLYKVNSSTSARMQARLLKNGTDVVLGPVVVGSKVRAPDHFVLAWHRLAWIDWPAAQPQSVGLTRSVMHAITDPEFSQ